jgi:hypothetical protein
VGVLARHRRGRRRAGRHPARALHRRLALPPAAPPSQRDNGLWVAPAVERLPDDPPRLPGPAMLQTVQALAEAIRKLQARAAPFAPPFRLDDAGWVANRWCELLPIRWRPSRS